jgi:hypothetical protein
VDDQKRLANALQPQAELRAYQPTLRDRIASFFVGDERASPEKARLVEGLLGSRGLGSTGMGLVDLTPAGAPLWTDEYKRAETPTDAAWAAMNFIPGAKNMAQLSKGMADEAVKGIRAYHGSPHDFDRFDMSKIGTGEGAQAYGHGLYFADNEDVARSYRDSLAQTVKVNGNTIHSANKQVGTTGDSSVDDLLIGHNGDLEAAIAEERAFLDEMRAQGRPAADDTATLQKLEALRGSVDSKNTGHMYEVNINADPEHFMDYDKDIQSEHVQQAMRKVFARVDSGELQTQADISKAYAEAGIPGIRYLDQGSRGAGEGSRNYVVFDDKLIEILRKYGLVGTAGPALMANALLSSGSPPPDETF